MGLSLEFEDKLRRVGELLDDKDLDALLLRQVSSFYWATCGVRADVNLASSYGAASLLITRKSRFLVANNLETTRYEQNDRIASQGWELCISPWYAERDMLQHLTEGLKIGSDSIYPGAQVLAKEISLLRSELTEEERDPMRSLGKLCTQVIEFCCTGITARNDRDPTQCEFGLSGCIARNSGSHTHRC